MSTRKNKFKTISARCITFFGMMIPFGFSHANEPSITSEFFCKNSYESTIRINQERRREWVGGITAAAGTIGSILLVKKIASNYYDDAATVGEATGLVGIFAAPLGGFGGYYAGYGASSLFTKSLPKSRHGHAGAMIAIEESLQTSTTQNEDSMLTRLTATLHESNPTVTIDQVRKEISELAKTDSFCPADQYGDRHPVRLKKLLKIIKSTLN